MKDINRIWLKYEDQGLLDCLESLDDVNRLTLTFGEDVADTYRLITLRRNLSRDPSGYGLGDAPIVGLLTRVAKLFRLVCQFYRLGNGDHLAVFSRPLIESAIVATYLLQEGGEAVEDFRRCSYRDTLRILREHEGGSEFFLTPRGSARSTVRHQRSRSRGAVQAGLHRAETQSLAPPGKVAVRHLRRGDRRNRVSIQLRHSVRVHTRIVERIDGLVPVQERRWHILRVRFVPRRRCTADPAFGAIRDARVHSLERQDPDTGRLNAPDLRSYSRLLALDLPQVRRTLRRSER